MKYSKPCHQTGYPYTVMNWFNQIVKSVELFMCSSLMSTNLGFYFDSRMVATVLEEGLPVPAKKICQ